MDTAVETRDAGFIGSIIVGGPLQGDVTAGAFLEFELLVEGGVERAHSAREKGVARHAGQDFGGGATEGAVRGNVSRKGWCNEGVSLIG